MKQKIIHLLRRVAYWIKYRRDEYGKPGFTQLMYKGMPIKLDNRLKLNVVGFQDKESGKMEWINIVTGKTVKNPFKTRR